jgi:uncharacterized protein YndB with AHSA1/START domain
MDILHRVGIKSTPDAVYRALTTRDGLAAWWTDRTEGEGALGGLFTFRFVDGEREIGGFDIRVLALQPGRQVLWQVVGGPDEWIGTRIRWDIRQEGDYAIVLFRHEDWREAVEFMHHCSTKWAIFLMSLKALVETGAGQPNPADVKIDDWN